MKMNIEGLGKITASKATLNLIATLANNSSEIQKQRGLETLSKQSNTIFLSIYDQLDAIGYYDDCKE